ncbi:hypothetical protein NL676_029742 [Syzygium grande]|nr:hypothetical protein NL676_029742 [Syzygium grande]
MSAVAGTATCCFTRSPLPLLLLLLLLLLHACSAARTLRPSARAAERDAWSNWGGLDAYAVGSPESKLAILLVSDIYDLVLGLWVMRLELDFDWGRKLADKVAAAGFYVVVPDYFKGDPYAPENAERPVGVWIKDHGTVCSVFSYIS